MRCSLTTTLLAVLFVEAGAWQLATPLTSRSSVPATRRVLSPVCQEGPSDGSAYPTPPAIKRTKYEEVKGEGAVCDFPGCDQNGRAMGGLGAIPLFSWWPIKAYRPCPKCTDAGVKYSRSGQSLDEIVFKKNPKGGYYGDD